MKNTITHKIYWILPVILLIIMGIGFALTGSIFSTVDKETFKSFNFKTYNITCSYGGVLIIPEDNDFILTTTYTCLYAKLGGNDTIEIIKKPLILKYTDSDFFTCIRNGTKDILCFNNYVKPKWDEETINYQFILRRYLAQMQNSSNTILSKPLINYYQT